MYGLLFNILIVFCVWSGDGKDEEPGEWQRVAVGPQQVHQPQVPDAGDVPELCGGGRRLGRSQGQSHRVKVIPLISLTCNHA